MRIAIYVNIDEDSGNVDTESPMGITNEAFDRLAGTSGPLSWLGEVEDVEATED